MCAFYRTQILPLSQVEINYKCWWWESDSLSSELGPKNATFLFLQQYKTKLGWLAFSTILATSWYWGNAFPLLWQRSSPSITSHFTLPDAPSCNQIKSNSDSDCKYMYLGLESIFNIEYLKLFFRCRFWYLSLMTVLQRAPAPPKNLKTKAGVDPAGRRGFVFREKMFYLFENQFSLYPVKFTACKWEEKYISWDRKHPLYKSQQHEPDMSCRVGQVPHDQAHFFRDQIFWKTCFLWNPAK